MAIAAAKKEVAVVGVELTLTTDEAKTLVAYLILGGDPVTFRLKNRGLYALTSVLEGALA